MAEPTSGSDKRDFSERLSQAQQRRQAKTVSKRSADGTAMGIGMRLSLELVVATVIGGLLGYGADWLLGTSPWLMIVMVLVGAAAGVRNMLRAMDEINAAQAKAAAENAAADVQHERQDGSGGEPS